jgi:ubiquinone/menaquinone biosynthesis C-methylase UbiE
METTDGSPSFTLVAPYYDALMKDVPYRLWARHVIALARQHSREPQRILDLACGTGTVSLLLASRGYELVGVDRSAAMLDVARKKAAAAGASIQFIESDLRDFTVPGSFDLVICLYDSLNNILEQDGLRSAFQRARRALAPGGLFVFDLNTEFAFRTNLFTQKDMTPGAPVQYHWKGEYDYTERICTVTMDFWVNEAGRRVHFREVHHQRPYSEVEIQRLLASAGLTLVAAYDGLSHRPPERDTDRIYCIARLDTDEPCHRSMAQVSGPM